MSLKEKILKGLNKNIIFLGIVSGLTDISSEMLYPVVPIFLTTVLNAPMTIVGLIEGIAESTASTLKIIGGFWSDRSGQRKKFVVAGYSISAISKPLMALAFSWHLVLIARFIDRVGKGIRTSARDTLISTFTYKEHWGRAFGFHRAMDTFGAAIGPLVTLILLKLLGENSYRAIFIIAFIPALIGVMVLWYFVEEYKTDKKEISLKIDKNILTPELKIFSILYLLFAFGNSSDAFLILRAKNLDFNTSSLILVYFCYNILYSLLAIPAGIIADKFGKINSLIFGMAIFSLVYYGFAITDSKGSIWFLFICYALYAAFNEGIYKTVISHFSVPEKRASAMGIFQGTLGLMLFLSSFIAGILWDRLGAPAPFYFGSLMAIISALSLFLWSRYKNIQI